MTGYAFTLAKVADAGRTAAKRIFGRDDGSRDILAYDHVARWYFRPKQSPPMTAWRPCCSAWRPART